jgi:hypothetical protein
VAVRSIIDVVVNTGAFQRFAAMYARYQQTLPATVDAWKRVTTTMKSLEKSMKDAGSSVKEQYNFWNKVAGKTKEVASNLKSATESLLRWTGITAAISGLIGVGSLWGLDRLALGVGAGRREATGVGTTYGQQTAFNLSYGRFVDHSFLGRISDAASDPTKSWVLRRLGATPQTLAAGNSADIARQILPSLEKFAKTTDINKLGLLAKALHYTDVISEEELKRLRASQPGELAAQGPKYGARLEAFKRTGATEEQYQSFAEKLEEAGETIKNVFVIGLQPVIPKLTELSGALTSILVRFLKEIKPSDIETLATKIGEFATYLGSAEFKERLETFITKLGELGESVVRVAEKFHLISPAPLPAFQHEQGVNESTANVVTKRGILGTVLDPVGTAVDILRGVGNPAQEEIPLPRARPNVFGNVAKPDTNPRIGGGSNNMGENFNNYWNASVPQIKNQSSQEVTLTVQSPAGSSTPKAAAMVGTK